MTIDDQIRDEKLQRDVNRGNPLRFRKNLYNI